MEMEQLKDIPTSKHICKFCNRRFACGRALGGHMRIHGSEFNSRGGEDYHCGVKRRRVSEAQSKNDLKQKEKEEKNDDQEDEEEEEAGSCDNDLNKTNNPMYDLRPNRQRSWRYADVDYSFMVPANVGDVDELGSNNKFMKDYQICEECGKEFTSSTALIAHIRCHHHHMKAAEEEEEDESDDFKEQGEFFYWDSESDTETVRIAVNSEKIIKGKRSARPRQRAEALEPPTPEVEFVANCLVMLSSSGESWEQPRKQKKHADVTEKMDFKHPSSVTKTRKRRRASPSNNNSSIGSGNVQSESVKPPAKKTKYECKTCKKMFQSFQALGGHRASHNKYKGCSAKQEEEEADNENLGEEIITSDEDLSKGDDLSKSTPNNNTKTGDSCDEENESMAAEDFKIKKVDVCPKTFSSGQQVVGGYWVATTTTTTSSSKQKHSPWLDLNLPAPDEDSPPKKWSEKQVIFSDAESSDRDNNLTADTVTCRNIAALPH